MSGSWLLCTVYSIMSAPCHSVKQNTLQITSLSTFTSSFVRLYVSYRQGDKPLFISDWGCLHGSISSPWSLETTSIEDVHHTQRPDEGFEDHNATTRLTTEQNKSTNDTSLCETTGRPQTKNTTMPFELNQVNCWLSGTITWNKSVDHLKLCSGTSIIHGWLRLRGISSTCMRHFALLLFFQFPRLRPLIKDQSV